MSKLFSLLTTQALAARMPLACGVGLTFEIIRVG